MARDRDDALVWDGDDDPTLDVGAERLSDDGDVAEAVALPEGWTAVGRGSDAVAHVDAAPVSGSRDVPVDTRRSLAKRENTDALDAAGTNSATATSTSIDPDTDPRTSSMSNTMLISLGVLGGIFLLYAIGWLIGGLRLQDRGAYLVTDVMYQGSLWLATLAPLIWFVVTMLLTRGGKTWVRFVWLAAGAILLIPWPFIMVGAVGV